MATPLTRSPRWRRIGAAVAPLGLLLAGCASDAELDSLDPQGENAENIDKLAFPVFIVAGIVLFLVVAGTLLMVIKFRQGRHPEDEWPSQNEGNTNTH